MDTDLTRLKRATLASPTDESHARAYDTALLRAGRRQDVEARYREKFSCSGRWIFTMKEREDRYCWECSRPAVRADGVRQAVELLSEDRCVVIEFARVKDVIATLASSRRLHTAREPDAPRLAPLRDELEEFTTHWYWLLHKAEGGSYHAPGFLRELENDAFKEDDRGRLERFLLFPTPGAAPDPWSRPPAERQIRGSLPTRRVARSDLMHDALVHCRDHWSLDEYWRLAEVPDSENYNSLDVVAAMLLLGTVRAELDRL